MNAAPPPMGKAAARRTAESARFRTPRTGQHPQATSLPLPPPQLPARDDATVLVAKPLPLDEVRALSRGRLDTEIRAERRRRGLLLSLAVAAVLALASLLCWQVAAMMTGA